MKSPNITAFVRRWRTPALLSALALAASLTFLQPVVVEARVDVAGSQVRNVQFLPEPDDEVLIQFEPGDSRQPYVIGALWDDSDTPPESSD